MKKFGFKIESHGDLLTRVYLLWCRNESKYHYTCLFARSCSGMTGNRPEALVEAMQFLQLSTEEGSSELFKAVLASI